MLKVLRIERIGNYPRGGAAGRDCDRCRSLRYHVKSDILLDFDDLLFLSDLGIEIGGRYFIEIGVLLMLLGREKTDEIHIEIGDSAAHSLFALKNKVPDDNC